VNAKTYISDLPYSDLGGAALGQLTAAERKKLAFQNARRVQSSVLTSAEKRILLWLAERTPLWVDSDHLTLLGLMAQLAVGASYALSRWDRRALLLATFFLAVNWLGDSLDGTLARYRNRQRPRYGFYVDHIIDSFGALFLMTGLALSGYMHPLVAMALLTAFLMLSIEVYLATYALASFHLSFFGLGPTEIRLVLAIGNLALFMRGPWAHIAGHVYSLFDIGAVVAVAGMGMMLISASLRHALQLYREERLR